MSDPAPRNASRISYTMEDRERVGRLEGDVAALKTTFEDLRTDVREGFQQLGSAVDRQAQVVANRSRTNWGLVISGLGGLIAVFGLAAAGIGLYVSNTVRPQELAIDYVERDLTRLHQDLDLHRANTVNLINEELAEFDAISRERTKTIAQQIEAAVLRERVARLEDNPR